MNSPTKDPFSVSLRLEQLLEERGVTRSELAARLGVSRAAVSRMLAPQYEGHSVPTLNKIAEALGVRLELNFVGDLEVLPRVYDPHRILSRWRTHRDTPDLEPPVTEDDYQALRTLEDTLFRRLRSTPDFAEYHEVLERINSLTNDWLEKDGLLEPTS